VTGTGMAIVSPSLIPPTLWENNILKLCPRFEALYRDRLVSLGLLELKLSLSPGQRSVLPVTLAGLRLCHRRGESPTKNAVRIIRFGLRPAGAILSC
jgi:hypothetical protein